MYPTAERPVVGIDNGLDGAFVVNVGGKLEELMVMPTIKTGKDHAIDVMTIGKFIERLRDRDAIFLLEQASHHSPGKMALCSTWCTFGSIRTLLKWLQVTYEIVPPQKWQKLFWVRPKLPPGQKFDTKAAALAAATRVWPTQDWTKSARASTPHDGLVDAALIAEFGRRTWHA